MPHVSIVAPVYDEQAVTLSELVRQLGEALAPITGDFDIILVDDGSRNDAWSKIVSLSEADRRIIGIRLTRNFGQHAAIAAGIDHAKGDWVVVMDSDLQDRPAVIPDLYRRANEGFDVVFVNRQSRPESVAYRAVTYLFYSIFNFLAGHRLDRRQGNFSIISREVADAYRRVPDRDSFYAATLSWLGFRQSAIEACHGEREAGRPSYTLVRLLQLGRRVIVGYSTRLLYVAIGFGIVMALVSFALVAKIVVDKLLNPDSPVPGWASVMSGVFFTAGVTNVMLGLIGLYIAELFERSKQRPIYIVRQYAGSAPDGTAVLPTAGEGALRSSRHDQVAKGEP